VRIAAAKALKDMGVPTTAEALQDVVLEDELEVRRAAAAALSNIPLPSARAQLVTASKKDKDPEVRRWAATGLGRAPLSEVANDLARLLTDKDAAVRAAAARAVAGAHETELAAAKPDAKGVKPAPKKLAEKLVDAVRKAAKKDKDEDVRSSAVRSLAVLLPQDEEARDLAMQLVAGNVKTGDLRELATKLPAGVLHEAQDKRIVTALLKRLEKAPSAEVILALANQNDERVPEAIHGLIGRLWGKVEETTRAQVLAVAEARQAVTYALVREQSPASVRACRCSSACSSSSVRARRPRTRRSPTRTSTPAPPCASPRSTRCSTCCRSRVPRTSRSSPRSCARGSVSRRRRAPRSRSKASPRSWKSPAPPCSAASR
jgi:HEAT repeat protein